MGYTFFAYWLASHCSYISVEMKLFEKLVEATTVLLCGYDKYDRKQAKGSFLSLYTPILWNAQHNSHLAIYAPSRKSFAS